MNDQKLYLKKRRNDALAKWFISVIGVGTILAVLTIIVVIISEILPLFITNELTKKVNITLPTNVVATNLGPWFEKTLTLDEKGKLSIYDIHSKKVEKELSIIKENQQILSVERGLDQAMTLRLSDQSLMRLKLGFKPTFDQESRRTIVFNTKTKEAMAQFPEEITTGLSRETEDGLTVFSAITKDGKLLVSSIEKSENFLGEVEETKNNFEVKVEGKVAKISANELGNRFYSVTDSGVLEFWDIRATSFKSRGQLQIDLSTRKITHLVGMVGIDEVALGFDNGEIEVVALASVDGGVLEPVQIHRAKVANSNIKELIASPRNRTLFAIDDNSVLTAWYSTNERRLITKVIKGGVETISVADRGHGLSITSRDRDLSIWHWNSPHPEGGYKAFFSKIWYSGYSEPEYAWQSSSGSDDFEPKISLVPLIYGSIKGAFYAMLFSVPLAVFAALYTSVFAGTRVRSIIKPIVELMSAIPSVVVGFLGALWLAPLIDSHLLEMAISLPLMVLILAFLPKIMGQVGGKDLMMLRPGSVLIISGLGLVFSFVLASPITFVLESSFFEGDFRTWLVEFMNGNYDMRNSIIIGMTLGFAVIPIIYTISEDSISSVPRGLMSASLALGATPWQTAWRVILPAASPGIFAAVTLGLGRAVGETMIVLMATGNTPIMDMNIFEGFRALSANIAVEMPEAPVGGTLYRTLFLSAGVLLVFTSVLNTITEIVRHRLSKTYSKL